MERVFFGLGAISAALAVALGAFAAHGLRSRISADALALLAVAWAVARWPSAWTSAAGWLFVAGTVLFSGSLYLLAVTGVRALGAITPLGGLAFILGWLALAWSAWTGR